jgi:hypothetical protein
MADDLLGTCIRQLLESQPGPEVIVGWQGGEREGSSRRAHALPGQRDGRKWCWR